MITDPKVRADLVYDAEWAAGIAVLRPFPTVADAQLYADQVIKRPWWLEKIASVNSVSLSYTPSWNKYSNCTDHTYRAKVELTIGNICEGTCCHELAHCARGDVDNSHGPKFLKAQVCILDEVLPGYELLYRYVRALLDRDLLTGRERWLRDPDVLRPALWAGAPQLIRRSER